MSNSKLGTVTVVCGKPGCGKTKYALELCKKEVDNNAKVSYVYLDKGGRDKIVSRTDFKLDVIDKVDNLIGLEKLVGFKDGTVVVDYLQIIANFEKEKEAIVKTLEDMAKKENWHIVLLCMADADGSVPSCVNSKLEVVKL